MGVLNAEEMALLPLPSAGGASSAKAHDGATPDDPTLASDAKTFVSAVVAFLGTGVLGLPSAFMKTGVLLGLSLLVGVGVLSAFCMLLLVDCKYLLQRRGVAVATYGDIGRHALGTGGQRLVEVALVLAQTGFGVGFLIFVATNVHSYFGVARAAVIAWSAPPLAGFALLKHVSQLAYVALAASVMNLCGLAIVYVTDLSLMTSDSSSSGSSPSAHGGSLSDLHWLGSLSSAPFFFGVATYCFSGIGMVLPLETAMRHKRRFRRLLAAVVLLVGLVYASFGVCGYLAFGARTHDVLLLNLRGLSRLAPAVDLLFCASVFFGYPVMLFPVFDALQHMVVPERTPLPDGRRDCGRETRITVFRASVVGVTAIVAAAVPNFAPFISFVGSTCCSLLGFVLPVLFYLRLASSESTSESLPAPRRRLLLAVMALGVLGVVAGVANAAADLF